MKAGVIKQWLAQIPDDHEIEALAIGGDLYEPIQSLQAVTAMFADDEKSEGPHETT